MDGLMLALALILSLALAGPRVALLVRSPVTSVRPAIVRNDPAPPTGLAGHVGSVARSLRATRRDMAAQRDRAAWSFDRPERDPIGLE